MSCQLTNHGILKYIDYFLHDLTKVLFRLVLLAALLLSNDLDDKVVHEISRYVLSTKS